VAYLDKGAPLLLRDAEGQHYEAPRRAYDTTTRLRRQAALAETQSGIVIIIVPARIRGRVVPLLMPGWEIRVQGGEGWYAVGPYPMRGYREAAALVEGLTGAAFAAGKRGGETV
jgi:hypothetical protein